MPAHGVWGEGFVSDTLFELASVRDWRDLSDGEAVRFFPALRRRGAELSPELVRRVHERADEIETSATLAAGPEKTGSRWGLRARSKKAQFWPPVTLKDATWLRSLVNGADAHKAVQDLRLIAYFGFLTGLHPAYLWEEIDALPSWGAATAWLGELSRRGRALLPLEVADYLADALGESAEGVTLRDASLSALICDRGVASALLAASRRALAGERAEVRCKFVGQPGSVFAPAILKRAFAGVKIN